MVIMQFILSTYCIYARVTALMKNFRSTTLEVVMGNFIVKNFHICRVNLLSEGDDLAIIRVQPVKEKRIIENVSNLYDVLSDAVDEINSVFSKEVT